MIVKMEAANMVLQAMAKVFTEQLQRMFHTSWNIPSPTKLPLRGQSICPAAPFLLTKLGGARDAGQSVRKLQS